MTNSLKGKTINGMSWSIIENLSVNGINFVISIVLARLLTPAEFGLLGMVTIFLTISSTFIDSGLSQALIRKSNCTQEDYSTVFFYGIFVSIVCYLLIFAFSDIIAAYFKTPQLTDILKIVGLIIIINSFYLIQNTILTKQLNFKLKAKVTFSSSIISGIAGIYFAYIGYGVWSLVIKMILQNLLLVCFFWVFNKWRPAFIFSKESFKELFGFSSKLLISYVIGSIYSNIYQVIIAKRFSPEQLGFYTRAQSFNDLASTNITNVFSKVSYPVLSSIGDDNVKLLKAYKKLIKTTFFISLFTMLSLAATAESFIIVMVGEKWLVSAEYLQIMCFSGILYPLHSFNLNILQVKGRSDLFLKIEVLKKILAVSSILAAIYLGIIPMLYTMFVVSVLAYFLNSYWSGMLINYSSKEQLWDLLPSFLITGIAAMIAFAISRIISSNHLIILSAQAITMILITVVLSELFKLEAYLEIKSIIKSVINKSRISKK